jgi:hypothetical protein
VKQPINAYGFFLKDRVASGDIAGMRITEIGQLVGKEWKSLSPGDKKVRREGYASQVHLADILNRSTKICKLPKRLVTWKNIRRSMASNHPLSQNQRSHEANQRPH